MDLFKIFSLSYFTGIASGLLGIGGGFVMNPTLLSIGYSPEVSTAISAFCVLFTSSSTTTQFIIQGSISIQDSVVFLTVSSIGSYFGGLLISAIVDKYRRPSLLVWLLLFFMITTVLLMPTLGIYRIYQTGILGFEKPC